MDSSIGRRAILSFGVAALGARVLAACGGGAKDAVIAVPAPDPSKGASGWATGGTAAMKNKATYPDPFIEVGGMPPSMCKVTCQLTEGPCYSSQAEEIRDISYGQPGLPMQLRLRIVDPSCKPIAGALVDVWHVSPTGKYSGNDSAHEQVEFCTGNDPAYTTKLYFRGKQKTDTNGVVIFDTCFPGWYQSRTVHVHMTISVNGQAFVTTQLGFADALDDEIIATQPTYSERGRRDTTNTTDTVLPATGVEDYLFATQRTSDGALLASKTIVLRAKTTDAICGDNGPPHGPGAPGGPGGPGGFPGGPPPGGFGHGPPPAGGRPGSPPLPGHPPPPLPDGGRP